ncbi:hypothetical protein CHUAL_001661, partial [Chamberlinius hualienensis]
SVFSSSRWIEASYFPMLMFLVGRGMPKELEVRKLILLSSRLIIGGVFCFSRTLVYLSEALQMLVTNRGE